MTFQDSDLSGQTPVSALKWQVTTGIIRVFDGKVAGVGKGLDPFRNMSKRNGTRPFPTIKFTILVNHLPYS